KKLVRLADDVPVDFDWEGCRLKPLAAERVIALCREWGFRTLEAQFRDGAAAGPAPAPAVVPARGGEDFLFGANVAAAEPAPAEAAPPPAPWQKDYRLVDTPERFEAFFAELRKQK